MYHGDVKCGNATSITDPLCGTLPVLPPTVDLSYKKPGIKMVILFLAWTSCKTSSRFVSDLKIHDADVTSVYAYKHNSGPFY